MTTLQGDETMNRAFLQEHRRCGDLDAA
jgi:hypothetical protein